MKINVMPVSEQLSEETKQQLSEQVKETVAKDAIKKKRKNKTFTASEMWNRHQQRKSASYMMRRWNLN